jgi:tetratricopeptide (TPR) repeat protein
VNNVNKGDFNMSYKSKKGAKKPVKKNKQKPKFNFVERQLLIIYHNGKDTKQIERKRKAAFNLIKKMPAEIKGQTRQYKFGTIYCFAIPLPNDVYVVKKQGKTQHLVHLVHSVGKDKPQANQQAEKLWEIIKHLKKRKVGISSQAVDKKYFFAIPSSALKFEICSLCVAENAPNFYTKEHLENITSANATKMFNIYINYARILSENNKPEATIDACLSAKKFLDLSNIFFFLKPQHQHNITKIASKIYNPLVNHYGETMDYAKAIVVALKMIEMYKPEEHHLLYYQIGGFYVEIDQNENAKKYLHKALKLKPKGEHILTDLGRCYYELGEYDNALKYTEDALMINKNHPQALFNKVLINKASNSNNTNSDSTTNPLHLLQQALKAAEKMGGLIRTDFKQQIVAKTLESYLNNEKYNAAIKLLTQHLSNPELTDEAKSRVHFSISCTFRKMDNNKLAKRHIEKAIEMNPTNPMYYIEKASICAELREQSECMKSVWLFFELLPKKMDDLKNALDKPNINQAFHQFEIGFYFRITTKLARYFLYEETSDDTTSDKIENEKEFDIDNLHKEPMFKFDFTEKFKKKSFAEYQEILELLKGDQLKFVTNMRKLGIAKSTPKLSKQKFGSSEYTHYFKNPSRKDKEGKKKGKKKKKGRIPVTQDKEEPNTFIIGKK